MTAKKTITAEEFDRRFDEGESVIEFLDMDSLHQPNRVPKRVNVDFPAWVVSGLDKEASRLGVTRQALIKIWIAERLEKA